MQVLILLVQAVVLLCVSSKIFVYGQRRLVDKLPRLEFEVKFKQYSGYLTSVNGIKLFYWLIEASHVQPETAPLLLWLNGGPGCSSVGGLLMTNGPFLATDEATLRKNPFAWNREANMLYIDSPAGAGLSQTNAFNESLLNDEFTTKLNLKAVLHFFQLFPEYNGRRFFIAGESYAGIYIPLLSAALLKRKEFPTIVNLIAVGIGNGLHVPIDDPLLRESRDEFSLVMGLELDYDLKVAYHNLSVNSYNCADPCYRNKIPNVYPCLNSTGLVTYLNDPEVRRALGVLPSVGEYVICQQKEIFVKYDLFKRNVLPEFEILVKARVSIMLYHGHLDLLIPFRTTQRLLENFTYSVQQDFVMPDAWLFCRKSFGSVRLQVGGLQQSFGNGRLILRSVLGAGHTVPTDLPEAGYQILIDLLRPSTISPSCENYAFDQEASSNSAGGFGRCNLMWLILVLVGFAKLL